METVKKHRTDFSIDDEERVNLSWFILLTVLLLTVRSGFSRKLVKNLPILYFDRVI